MTQVKVYAQEHCAATYFFVDEVEALGDSLRLAPAGWASCGDRLGAVGTLGAPILIRRLCFSRPKGVALPGPSVV